MKFTNISYHHTLKCISMHFKSFMNITEEIESKKETYITIYSMYAL